MISMFRTTALAAALAVASFGAVAGPLTVKLDLFQLGEDAKAADSGNGAPVAVGEIDGFLFSDNAFGYHSDMLKPGVSPGDDVETPAIGTTGPFIMNGDRNTGLVGGPAFMPISISLGQTFAGEKRYFQSLKSEIFSSAAIKIRLFSGQTQVGPFYEPDAPQGLAWEVWTPGQGTEWAETLAVDRIEIDNTTGYFGMKEIFLTVSGGTSVDPNPAPEPAGYALVGLALLAAGATSRRRS